MKCLFCKKDGAEYQVKPKSYFGTVSYAMKDNEPWHFCDSGHYDLWWSNMTWHMDTLDERMNANIHFQRTDGEDGIYKGKPAKASWNGLEARNFLGEYEFQNRRPHPKTCHLPKLI